MACDNISYPILSCPTTLLYSNFLLYCTVLYCTILHCTVLYYTALYCTVHHGGIQQRSTVTATGTLFDQWPQNLENDIDTAAIILDQSAAYNIVPHDILVNKLTILGADNHAQSYFQNYLKDRTQKVTLDGTYSEELHVGPMSVVQGSTLSCLLYLIYILDLATLYHTIRPTVKQQEECPKPSPTTFVDDTVVTLQLKDPQTNQTELENCFKTIQKIICQQIDFT